MAEVENGLPPTSSEWKLKVSRRCGCSMKRDTAE